MEQTGEHPQTALFDFNGFGVFFMIDDVFVRGFEHQLLGFIFLQGLR